jgi:cellobiose phosphorylase
MACDRGESVAFTAAYAGNLLHLAEAVGRLISATGTKQIDLAEEMDVLLEERAPSIDISPDAKQSRLVAYRRKIHEGITGRKKVVRLTTLAEDLRSKGESLSEHVRRQEWITHPSGHSWFNGYYDNQGRRVEGAHPKGARMTLTGQVFPILSGVASEEQVERVYLAVKRHLQDKKFGGFRLNTDFKEIQPDLGRAFSFAYGEKENGSFFSHMVVMLANALYRRGFVNEGYEVLSSLYGMCMNQDAAKVYPGIPEYFNGEGRGMYHYLTGSASWYLLTFVTQVLGLRGLWGDLLLAPKLMPEQFGKAGQITATVPFAGKRIAVTYLNRERKPCGKYHIESVLLQGQNLTVPSEAGSEFVISRTRLREITDSTVNITVVL